MPTPGDNLFNPVTSFNLGVFKKIQGAGNKKSSFGGNGDHHADSFSMMQPMYVSIFNDFSCIFITQRLYLMTRREFLDSSSTSSSSFLM